MEGLIVFGLLAGLLVLVPALFYWRGRAVQTETEHCDAMVRAFEQSQTVVFHFRKASLVIYSLFYLFFGLPIGGLLGTLWRGHGNVPFMVLEGLAVIPVLPNVRRLFSGRPAVVLSASSLTLDGRDIPWDSISGTRSGGRGYDMLLLTLKGGGFRIVPVRSIDHPPALVACICRRIASQPPQR